MPWEVSICYSTICGRVRERDPHVPLSWLYLVNFQTASDLQSHIYESTALVNDKPHRKIPPKQKPQKINCLVNIAANTNANAIAIIYFELYQNLFSAELDEKNNKKVKIRRAWT